MPNGANPLEVVYWFLVKDIGQSTPIAGKLNTLTVTPIPKPLNPNSQTLNSTL